MDRINPAWIYPLILIAGLLQAWGPPMNGALRTALANPWLASLVSFLPIVALLGCAMRLAAAFGVLLDRLRAHDPVRRHRR